MYLFYDIEIRSIRIKLVFSLAWRHSAAFNSSLLCAIRATVWCYIFSFFIEGSTAWVECCSFCCTTWLRYFFIGLSSHHSASRRLNLVLRSRSSLPQICYFHHLTPTLLSLVTDGTVYSRLHFCGLITWRSVSCAFCTCFEYKLFLYLLQCPANMIHPFNGRLRSSEIFNTRRSRVHLFPLTLQWLSA